MAGRDGRRPAGSGADSPRPASRLRARLALKIALAVLLLAAACGLALGVASLFQGAKLFEKDVSDRFSLYIEGLRPSGKLVLYEGVQRYTASRDFTAMVLAVLRIDARIELSALADVAYYVDFSDPGRWKVAWSAREKRLSVRAPAPDLLPPAVRTDSIEVHTEGANLVSNSVFRLKKEAEAMKAELSADMLVQGRKALAEEELRSMLEERLAELASSFCLNVLSAKPSVVDVTFE